MNVQKFSCRNTNVFDYKALSDPSGMLCHIEYMYQVTCLKLQNCEFCSISDPKGFRNGLWIVPLNPILQETKLRLRELSPFSKVAWLGSGNPR